jgi:2,3-bisphosphoglycerate-independent phosphoglycerate mutase
MSDSATRTDKQPHVLLILDGWGEREPAADNAISCARTPNWTRMRQNYPWTLIRTDGLAVGLPEGQMGNSEVGHMNLGAGRVVYQDLTRINLAIENGEFQQNEALNQACAAARRAGSTLHVFGLLSDGGVHAEQTHIFAMLKLARARGVQRIAVHAFLDGRDTPPKSAESSLRALDAVLAELPGARLATVSGRYFAMDRDKRWDRVELAYQAIAHSQSEFAAANGLAALEAAYTRGESDEFVKPTVIDGGSKVSTGDVIVFMNFRADRAREISHCFVDLDFTGFARGKKIDLASYVTLTEYSKSLDVSAVAFAPQDLNQTLPELIAEAGKTQLRIAETEKYAHVTFFFSGGVEQELAGEQRILVPSPKVATYDLQPEMSCKEVSEKLAAAIRSKAFDLLVCNIANPDMVGHTGILDAAVRAVETVDTALGIIEAAVLETGGRMIVTADHGNLEEMWDSSSNQPNTQHSMNPVPCVLIGASTTLRAGGALQDIAPTLLQLMGMPKPAVMSGQSLLSK